MPVSRTFSKYRVIEDFLNQKVIYPALQIHLLDRRLTIQECHDTYAECVEMLLEQHPWLAEATVPGALKDIPLDRWLARKGKLKRPLRVKSPSATRSTAGRSTSVPAMN
jgi:hypothetical protein